MVFPFGVSISDFIEGIKLFKNAIKALSDTRGARADYMELSRSLSSLDNALSAASAVVLDTDTRREALKTTVEDCRKCVTSFLVDVAKFELLKNQEASKRNIVAGFRKIQWAICKKDDVVNFRSQVEMHVGALDMLLLTFQVESLMRVSANVEHTDKIVVSIENQMKDCLTGQNNFPRKAKNGNKAQTKSIAFLEEEATSRSAVSTQEGNILLDIQQKLRSALSPEDQQMVFHFMQETLEKNEQLKQEIVELKCQNQCLERHMLEIKASVQIQRDITPQVFLRQPVILHDALGRIVPFHLEFISSAAALTAVLKVRFQNVGMRKIISNEYKLRDTNKQTDVDIYMPWESVFLPGQHIEMSMLFPGNGLKQNCCPGCSSYDPRQFKEGEQVRCPKCPMSYSWTRKAMEFGNIQEDDASITRIADAPDEISSFCRVDVVKPETRKKKSPQREDADRSRWRAWYCCSCGDGPFSYFITFNCITCNHATCTGCTREIGR